MIRIILAFFCLTLSGPALADDAAGTVELNGTKIVIAPDFTWRFDDSGGERCTNLYREAAVCALPSIWSSVPGKMETGGPRWFQQGTDLRAKVAILQGVVGETITSDVVFRIINADRDKKSGFGLDPEETDALLAGQTPKTVVSVIGTGETRAYSYAYLPDGRAVLVTTVEQPSYHYSLTHRKAHAAFVSAVKFEVQQ